ncbi:hypothetical protein [Elizabethkingia miricola]|uniref:Uncharacterized protein n=1 Tax=Elizabethkingia miricola TaxID=172045 RepID=A0ABD5B5C0_ELIMR|nr:hypothetical protein [Elizabethkingia miricola]MDQ8748591.1 hypothetical protein [Elizabethkingia miricola]OPB88216.1 hypothetical protein BAS06_13675 [Elizabethkingia miricola]PSL86737.1 hypothetical protein C7V10_19025 [Elizabethkingia miricola]QHQ85847.1 hypothetical protein FE632_03175 [Elizabethkingia miricola]UIO97091.1 hypothetical protein LYZ41_03185 [Elizabethkingia miricola]
MKKTQEDFLTKIKEKKDYFPPSLEVIIIKMECGIAANSASVSPVTEVDQISTDWNGNDDTSISAGFDY